MTEAPKGSKENPITPKDLPMDLAPGTYWIAISKEEPQSVWLNSKMTVEWISDGKEK